MTPLLLLLGLIALPLGRYFLAWPTPLIYPESELGTDLPREIWPLAAYVKQTLLTTGSLPLWRPYLLSGAPLVGHPIAPIFYPVHWLVLALPIPLALNLDALLHLWWAGAGTYLYLSLQHGIRREAALLGGIAFGLAPKWLAHLSGGHWPMLAAVAWWPWCWLSLERFLSTRRFRWAAVLGLGLASQALNHGTILTLTLLTLGGQSLFWLASSRARPRRLLIYGWAIALALASALSAVQILPLLEILPYSNRAAAAASEATFASLPPALLVGLFAPPELQFPEWFIYPGMVVLLLGLAGRNEPRLKRWIVVGLIGAGLSLGTYLPGYPWLQSVLPAWLPLRIPPRWWLLTLFGLAVQAALGFQHWLGGSVLSPREKKKWVALGVPLLALAGLDLVGRRLPLDPWPALATYLFTLVLLLLGPRRWSWILLLGGLVVETWWVGETLIRPYPEEKLLSEDRVAAYLAPRAQEGSRSLAPYGGIETPAMVRYGLRAADGYDSFLLSGYANLVNQASGCSFAGYAVGAPATRASPEAVRACPAFEPEEGLLALLNVDHVLLPAGQGRLSIPVALEEGTYTLYQASPGLGRAFGVGKVKVASARDCLEELLRIDPGEQAILEGSLELGTVAGEGGPPVRLVSREERVNGELFIVEASVPGLLVRSESWAPGWTVKVDGVPRQLLRVDCALQGVLLQSGRHTVRFEYAPRGYAIGRWISLLAALGLAALSVAGVPMGRSVRPRRWFVRRKEEGADVRPVVANGASGEDASLSAKRG